MSCPTTALQRCWPVPDWTDLMREERLHVMPNNRTTMMLTCTRLYRPDKQWLHVSLVVSVNVYPGRECHGDLRLGQLGSQCLVGCLVPCQFCTWTVRSHTLFLKRGQCSYSQIAQFKTFSKQMKKNLGILVSSLGQVVTYSEVWWCLFPCEDLGRVFNHSFPAFAFFVCFS